MNGSHVGTFRENILRSVDSSVAPRQCAVKNFPTCERIFFPRAREGENRSPRRNVNRVELGARR